MQMSIVLGSKEDESFRADSLRRVLCQIPNYLRDPNHKYLTN